MGAGATGAAKAGAAARLEAELAAAPAVAATTCSDGGQSGRVTPVGTQLCQCLHCSWLHRHGMSAAD